MKKQKKTGNTAAGMFRGLIMEGKLTDDQIFEKVQKAFGLPDKNRNHVTWYRNQMKKRGENPPPAKVAEKAPSKKVTKKKTTKKKISRKK